MKKILFAAFMLFSMLFIASCAAEEEISNALGGTCSVENAEACSADSSQILICRNSAWETKKTCNLNFGQYCRPTADGSFSCTDSGSSDNTDTGSSDNTDTDTNSDTTDTATEDTDTEPNENDQDPAGENDDDTEPEDDADSTSDDDPADTEPTDDTDTEPEDTTPIETCAGIVECQSECDTVNCSSSCYARGTTDAQNDFYESHQLCNTYTEIDDLKHCQELYVKCGLKGDETYAIPYGHAVINGSFAHIHEAGTTSFSTGTFIDTFVNGTFGSNGNIPDPTSSESFAFAQLNTAGDLIILRQTYNSNTETGKTPDVIFIIDVHAPGTYSVGLGTKDNINMIVSENTDVEANQCDHAFGYGYIELSGTGLTETYAAGAGTLVIKGEVDLYSYKNAPMYVGSTSNNGDITNENLVACQPK